VFYQRVADGHPRSAYGAPASWQTPNAERFTGSLRREVFGPHNCINESSLRRNSESIRPVLRMLKNAYGAREGRAGDHCFRKSFNSCCATHWAVGCSVTLNAFTDSSTFANFPVHTFSFRLQTVTLPRSIGKACDSREMFFERQEVIGIPLSTEVDVIRLCRIISVCIASLKRSCFRGSWRMF
jgi:hypothetical protein